MTEAPTTETPQAEEVDLADVDEMIASVGREQRHVVAILKAIQDRYHYLPEPALRRIVETTEISSASVAGVSTFYAQFRHRPAGRHTVRVCVGTACHVQGAETIYDSLRQHLRIEDADDTDPDRLFTVEKVACLGCCMLAPAVQIDDITYGFVEASKVSTMLADFLEAQKQTEATVDAGVATGATAGEVRVCLCSSCVAGGTLPVHTALQRQIGELDFPVRLKTVGCTGISYQTPMVDIAMADGRTFQYGLVAAADVRNILLRHFRPARPGARVKARVDRLLERLLSDEARQPVTRYAIDVRSGPDACYTGPQKRLVTEHAGELHPLDIDDYVRHDGFAALETCLKEKTGQDIVDAVKASGLRGRGGGGFDTGRKWQMVHDEAGSVRYLLCNGDEGDPGAFMDRLILESFPFRVIEGIIIASYAIGAHAGFMYVRSEYPVAIHRVRKALRICRERGYLGDNIRGSGHSLDLTLVEGAGAFVCGETTAMTAAIEGRRGMPRRRPPHSVEEGLWKRPTLPNNVETYASVPWIIRNGPEAFAALGTEHSKGTKAFSLAGKIVRGGLVEVPMGVTIRQMVEEIGGGITDGRALKAVQIGGPSGGCVPESLADTPVDYEALYDVGAMMGSGGLVVMDQDDCMVDIARYFLAFTQDESCGKCTHCRIGTKRMLQILDRLCEGKGQEGDIEKLEHLAAITMAGSLCGLGKSAPNPVLSTLSFFREEYEAHLRGRCPAGKCKALVRYVIEESCIGCTKCAQGCASGAIALTPHEQHTIDEEKCTRCDACRQVCPVEGAVVIMS